MKYIVLLSIVSVLVGCASGGKYLGERFFYNENGVEYECREPDPFKGGNCKPEDEWDD